MKKSIAIASIAALAGLVAVPALADPTIIVIDFSCPATTGSGPDVLAHFGYKIAGYGTQVIDGNPSYNSPYFIYSIPGGAHIPSKLTSYVNSGTDFDGSSGQVFCSYESGEGFDPFTAVYTMVNGWGGQIVSQTNNTIRINQFVGVKN